MKIEEMREFVEVTKRGALENLRQFGHVDPVCFAIVSTDPETLRPLPEGWGIVAVVPDFSTPSGKDRFAAVMTALGKTGWLIGYVFVSECWMATMTDAEQEAHARRRQKSLEHYPGRVERVVVTADHVRFGGKVEMYVADIERDAAGSPSSKGFEALPAVEEMQGRMTGFLPLVN